MKRLVFLFAAVALSSSSFSADKKIERLWKAKCASCHGKEGKGDTEKGQKMKVPDFTSAEFQQKKSDEDIKKQITNGVKTEKDGIKKEMDAFGEEIKGETLDQVVAYIRGLKQ
jgi:mono/diheme cytochrome c family protein